MAKIIFEDIKLNRIRRPVVLEKKTPISTKKVEEKVFYEEEIKKVEDKQKEEFKIEEYLKIKEKRSTKIPRTPRVRSETHAVRKYIFIIFIISLIAGLLYWGGDLFQNANINLTTKKQILNYKNKQFVAVKNGGAGVDFEIMITSDKHPVDLVLTEPKEVSEKATGSITLYNAFSTKAEKITAGTFVSDDDGKAYKTNTTVSIPGYKIDSNKKIIPGQINVGITSFLPGDAYNGSPESFSITSFKGTSKYTKIYGKLANPLSGGMSGLMYTMDDMSTKSLDNIAKTTFKDDLLKQVQALVPPGYILYPGAYNFTYKSGENIFSKTPQSKVELEGTIFAILLDKKSLVSNIFKASLPNIKGDELEEIKILDLDKLSFNFVNKDQSIAKDMNSVPFSLSGDLNLVWNPDTESIKNNLVGIYEDNVLSIFRQDPGISSAIVKIFPPWQSYIPNDTKKININME